MKHHVVSCGRDVKPILNYMKDIIKKGKYVIEMMCTYVITATRSKYDNLDFWKFIAFLSMFVGPCYHGMARPQVADGGTVCDMEGSCE